MTDGVLITSLSKKVPLIEAVREATKKVGAFQTLHGTDQNGEVVGKYFVDRFWQLDDLTFDSLLELCKRGNIQAIIPTRDGELPFFAKEKERFAKEGIAVMISREKTIELCQDKLLFAEQLRDRGFPSIHTALEPARHFQRWVVKERFSTAGRERGIDLAKEEVLSFANRLEHPIFQPYIEGTELSIDTYAGWGSVVRERNIVVNGESVITTTVNRPDLAKMTDELALFLGIEGHAVFQGIENDRGEFFYLECNPRFGGASTLGVAAGIDSFTLFFLGLKGEPLPLKEPAIFGLQQIRYPKDLIVKK